MFASVSIIFCGADGEELSLHDIKKVDRREIIRKGKK
jgi:hypothetical protein